MSDSQGKQWIFTLVGLFMILAIFGVPIAQKIENINLGSTTLSLSWMGDFGKGIGEYMFGIKEGQTATGLGGQELTAYAFTVIFLMLWLIIFVTFGDIFEAFSSFNPAVSWLIAFCFAVIGGMTGAYGGLVGKITEMFVFLGAGAVYAGLGFAFLMFLAVNFGLGYFFPNFKKYALQRKIDQEELSVRGHLGSAAAAAKALEGFGKDIQKDGSGI